MKSTPIPKGATVLDLAGGLRPKVTAWGFTVPGLTRKVLYIDWPDMSVPKLTVDEWRAIAKALAREKSVYVACAGGHGRTGTALAILGHFWGCLPKDMDPVDYLRKVYDGEAVETEPQGKYITEITGRPVNLARAWKERKPQGGTKVSDFRYSVERDGSVSAIRDMHKREYTGSYFGNRGGSAVDDVTDRSWTLGKKVDKGNEPCNECAGMNGKHMTWCARDVTGGV